MIGLPRVPRLVGLGLLLAASGCNDRSPEQSAGQLADQPAEPRPVETASIADERASIMRPEVELEAEVEVAAPPQPLTATLAFPEHGYALGENGRETLAALVAAMRADRYGAIILRGHSDSVGSDRANLAASRRRAEAVRDALVEQGVAPERIQIIALGEMRPLAPNAHRDGTPDEAGRARNRRVEVEILPAPEPPRGDGAEAPVPEPAVASPG